MISDVVELKTALAAGDLDRLLGTREDTWTGCPSNELVSVAETHARVPKTLVDLKQHADVLTNGVYPEVWSVVFSWFPSDNNVDAGLLLIEVPQQRPRDKPFVLRSMFGPDERQMTSALGIPVRNGSETIWLKAERLHPLLGGVFGTLTADPGDVEKARIERANEVVKIITRESGWTELPALFLQAFPPPGRPVLPDLHSRDGLRKLFADPPTLRSTGFDLGVGREVVARDGGLVRMDSRKALWLERDGSLTGAAVAGPEFLGWAMNPQEQTAGPYELNATAIVEYVYEFFRFVYDVLAPRASPGRWTFRVIANGWKSLRNGVRLAPGPAVRYRTWPEEAQLASGDRLDDQIDGTGSAERDAFTLLGRLYGLFGLPTSGIPFSANDSVSLELLQRLPK